MSPRGVVITGGANGVGYAYADSFMKRGHNVVICDAKDPSGGIAGAGGKAHQSARWKGLRLRDGRVAG